MSKQEKENKKNALFGTIIFHAILVFLLTLPFMSLTYQDPPLPSGKGISINFSSDNSGFTSQSNNQTLKEVEDEVVEDEIVEDEVVEDEVVEDEVVKDVVVKDEVVKDEVVKVDEKAELDPSLNKLLDIAEEKQKDSSKDNEVKSNERQDDNGKDDDGKDDDGKDDDGKDDDGKGDGQGNGNNEVTFDGIDRKANKFSVPKGNKNETGSVVIKITVDSKGKVILAQVVPSYKNIISTNDKVLRKNALQAAKNITFESKKSNEDDVGYAIFNFKVKGE